MRDKDRDRESEKELHSRLTIFWTGHRKLKAPKSVKPESHELGIAEAAQLGGGPLISVFTSPKAYNSSRNHLGDRGNYLGGVECTRRQTLSVSVRRMRMSMRT